MIVVWCYAGPSGAHVFSVATAFQVEGQEAGFSSESGDDPILFSRKSGTKVWMSALTGRIGYGRLGSTIPGLMRMHGGRHPPDSRGQICRCHDQSRTNSSCKVAIRDATLTWSVMSEIEVTVRDEPTDELSVG